MKRTLILAFTVGLVLSIIALTSPPAGGEDSNPTPSKLGFVNIKSLFSRSKMAFVFEADLNAYQDKAQVYMAKLQEVIAKEEAKLAGLRSNKDAWIAQKAIVLQLKGRLKMAKATTKTEINDRLKRATKEVYREICHATETYRKKKGFAAILAFTPKDLQASSSAEMALKVNTRIALSVDERLDVTEDILKIMNS